MADAIAISALCLSLVSLILATLSIAFIVGFKNSTHKIEWKPLPQNDSDIDPFAEQSKVDEIKNMFLKKEKSFKPYAVEPVKEDEPFYDIDDPNEESHKW